MARTTIDLRADKFSPIPTFFRVVLNRPKIAILLFLLGFLPSFSILLLSIFIPEPTRNFWFYLNNSCSSFFSVLLAYLVGQDLLKWLREDSSNHGSIIITVVLATVSLCVGLISNFFQVFIPIPLWLEFVLPIAGGYLMFFFLNVAITNVDTGHFSFSELGAILKKTNRRIGYGFSIGFSLVLLVIIAVIPVLLVSIIHVFLIFNKVYYFFFISLILPAFSSVFFLSYLKKEYCSDPKPMKQL